MALKDITPVMTSNTTPSPYVVSSSSITSTYIGVWKAFDGTMSNVDTDSWASASGSPTAWIKIDFGSATKIDAFSLYRRLYVDTNDISPKAFILYGSNDDISYNQIYKTDSQISWQLGEGRLYKLDSSVTYRYYKLQITESNYATVVAIGAIKFWQDDAVTTSITTKKSSMNYCLPKTTTLKMKQRVNDSREGLLGYVNDSDNYGTLYLINDKGQSQLTKSAMTDSDLLFDGVANALSTTYILAQSYKKYKYILVIGGTATGALATRSNLIPTKYIIPSKTYQFVLSVLGTTSNYFYITFNFTSETTFKLDDKIGVGTGWTDPAISKIYGIY